MNLRAWGTALKDALRSATQSSLMSLASVATVAVSLLVLSVVVLLAINLEHMAATVEQQVQVKAYLCSAKDQNPKCNKQDLKQDQKQAIVTQISKLPGVKKVTYVSKEQALDQMKQEFANQKDILNGLDGDNPLRDSIEISVADTKTVQVTADAVQKVAGVSDVNYGQEYVGKLLAFTHAIRLGGIGLVIMLIIATVLTLSNTIRLAVYARRREIGIMKLVGATDWYIRRPFMVEGIFLGVLGAAVAMGLTATGYGRLMGYLMTNVPFLPVVAPNQVLVTLTVGLIALGGALGAVGAIVSMRRFLKV